jgi:flagellar basal-body rod protein FlgG
MDMNTSLYTALVSMGALQQKLDTISKNVSNSNTTGYKRREATFEDLLTSIVNQPRELQRPGRMTPPGLVLGNGVRVNEIKMYTQQGIINSTGNTYDLTVDGNGFFEVQLKDENGNFIGTAFTRDGSFQLQVNAEDPEFSYLTTNNGHYVQDVDGNPIQVPNNARIQIDPKGNFSAYYNDGRIENNFARLNIVRILKPQYLENVGENLFVLPSNVPTDGVLISDIINNPTEGEVVVRQGFLEASNVNLGEEMGELISTQRSFQLLSRALTMSDTMMGMVNNLRV